MGGGPQTGGATYHDPSTGSWIGPGTTPGTTGYAYPSAQAAAQAGLAPHALPVTQPAPAGPQGRAQYVPGMGWMGPTPNAPGTTGYIYPNAYAASAAGLAPQAIPVTQAQAPQMQQMQRAQDIQQRQRTLPQPIHPFLSSAPNPVPARLESGMQSNPPAKPTVSGGAYSIPPGWGAPATSSGLNLEGESLALAPPAPPPPPGSQSTQSQGTLQTTAAELMRRLGTQGQGNPAAVADLMRRYQGYV